MCEDQVQGESLARGPCIGVAVQRAAGRTPSTNFNKLLREAHDKMLMARHVQQRKKPLNELVLGGGAAGAALMPRISWELYCQQTEMNVHLAFPGFRAVNYLIWHPPSAPFPWFQCVGSVEEEEKGEDGCDRSRGGPSSHHGDARRCLWRMMIKQ